MQQVIIDFGVLDLFGAKIPLRIYGYGLMLVLGFITGILLAQWRARRAGENLEYMGYCGILALIGGVVGARGAYVIENFDQFFGPGRNSSWAVFNVTSGGLIYYGGFILATILVLGYVRLKRRPIRRYLDLLAASLMIGLAFGRAGCLLNGCCYGDISRSDWALGMRFPMFSRPLIKLDGRENPFSLGTDGPTPPYAHQMDPKVGVVKPDARLMGANGRVIPPHRLTPEQVSLAASSHSHPVKPAQILGIVNALLLAGILSVFYRLRRREGQVFALLLILYPITRFLLELIRDHDHWVGDWTHNQYTSLAMFVGGVIMWVCLFKVPASAGPIRAQRVASETRTAVRRGAYKFSDGPRSRRSGRRKRKTT